ncbi:hypothetical protein VE04_01949 [Pseudogymnoascus sp. 24MN13]|nr:hypothetical protein VE04_01949 [Pseudogymnoascus sp. 24MN13]
MHPSTLLIALLAATATDLPALDARANTSVNPDSVTFTTCTDPGVSIDSHDINVAILSICGTIAGTIQKFQGPLGLDRRRIGDGGAETECREPGVYDQCVERQVGGMHEGCEGGVWE